MISFKKIARTIRSLDLGKQSKTDLLQDTVEKLLEDITEMSDYQNDSSQKLEKVLAIMDKNELYQLDTKHSDKNDEKKIERGIVREIK